MRRRAFRCGDGTLQLLESRDETVRLKNLSLVTVRDVPGLFGPFYLGFGHLFLSSRVKKSQVFGRT